MLSVWCLSWPITTWRRNQPRPPQSASPTAPPEGEQPTPPRSSPSGGGGPQGRRGTAAAQPPVALVATEGGTRRLAAVDDAAAALGLHVGQKAADAAALVPDLLTADHDPDGDRAALEILCDWCVRFSPAVALDGLDGLFLDVEGVSHLWGGEAAMLDDLLARLERWGAPARGAIADTPGAAWALARYAPDRTIAPPGGQAPLLAPLPVAALRLDEAAQAQLPRLGLFQVGQLLALPRAQLARRFGLSAMMRIDQALGDAREALTFRRPATPWFERLAFFEPISALEDLERVTRDICALLCDRLEAEGQGARRFELVFHRLDGRDQPVRAGLSRPGRDAARIARLLKPKLGEVDPGFGIEIVTLWAADVEALSTAQPSLDADGGVSLEEGLAPLVDRLVNRLGEDRVWRADPHQSHVPERSVVRQAPLDPPSEDAWDPDRPRPTRLLRRPEAIEVTAKLPDDPPVQFRWRGKSRRVRLAEGPERIGQEWWRQAFDAIGPGKVRDYYRVEDETGERFWIFRAGLYGDGETVPKWWLHGLFG
ncbi:DNA polymerase Y family protein [Caulobacter sp. UNC279MFTsu5.1]|uniref:Y-family DNA polymerase n=1 Tax=Caulobacter sp. UNC279MFTsu5.1 TaxID=1502775 RepID=UPI003517E437